MPHFHHHLVGCFQYGVLSVTKLGFCKRAALPWGPASLTCMHAVHRGGANCSVSKSWQNFLWSFWNRRGLRGSATKPFLVCFTLWQEVCHEPVSFASWVLTGREEVGAFCLTLLGDSCRSPLPCMNCLNLNMAACFITVCLGSVTTSDWMTERDW